MIRLQKVRNINNMEELNDLLNTIIMDEELSVDETWDGIVAKVREMALVTGLITAT